MIRVLQGEANRIPLATGSVDCVVTSPPYYGLRDYGIPSTTWADGWHGQLGHEKDHEQYIDHILEVFDEVWRILKPEGTVWLNLGDSYSARAKSNLAGQDKSGLTSTKTQENAPTGVSKTRLPGIKIKDLIGIPWTAAITLRSRGWYLRSDIVWVKPNPMPESVTDRPTRAHEYVFLLTKQDRYYYDAAAIREPLKKASIARISQDNLENQQGSERANGGAKTNGPMKPVVRRDKQRGHSRRHVGFIERWDAMSREEQQAKGANARDWWNIATTPYKGAHFAVMPIKLATRCILAGCPAGGTVHDPFTGAGTTGVAAFNTGRNFVGLERASQYLPLLSERLPPLFAK